MQRNTLIGAVALAAMLFSVGAYAEYAVDLEAGWADEDTVFAKAHPRDRRRGLFQRAYGGGHCGRARAGRAVARNRRGCGAAGRAARRARRLFRRIRAVPAAGQAARRAAYFEARRIKRAIAFANPRLDFGRLLFIERHHAKGVFHMCDQFYGFNAVRGGGLFVLEDPFGETPRLRNLLEDSIAGTGRFAGKPLPPGAYLSPELSFDGSTVYFAYSQAEGEDLEWSERASWHIFKVNADGTGLEQISDGPWDDFDPCELPDGRIAFNLRAARAAICAAGGTAPPTPCSRWPPTARTSAPSASTRRTSGSRASTTTA